MVKPEWGAKRVCHSCGSPFYDLHRDPITCPKCGASYDPEAILKSRRARPAVVEDKEVEVAEVEEAEAPEAEAPEAEEAEDDLAADAGEEEEDKELIEDASELGEDEDDMAEVIDNIDEEER
jgi:uncharacterized protein (TIGR02300 family)